MDVVNFKALCVVLLVIIIFLCILLIQKYRIKEVGELFMDKNPDGSPVWTFRFYDQKMYEALYNMNKITFKIKKGEK